MFLSAITVLLPIFFVMGLGYFAGRSKRFDADQIQGINELVLDYALPALFFVAVVSTTRSQLIAEASFLAAILIAFVGTFIAIYLISTRIFHHSTGAAALQANLLSFPSVGFIGPPIFKGMFGEDSLLSIATSAVVGSVTLIPLTLVLLEIHRQKTSGSAASLPATIWTGLVATFKKPMVWSPLIAAVLVLFDIDPPPVIDNMFDLIGSATAGASIFLAGLIISAYKLQITREILVNTAVKMVGQPLLMAGLVALFAVPNPLGRESILICAIPSSVLAPLISPQYHVYEMESAATLVTTSLAMIVTLPIAIVLTGS
jgi:predicted permease